MTRRTMLGAILAACVAPVALVTKRQKLVAPPKQTVLVSAAELDRLDRLDRPRRPMIHFFGWRDLDRTGASIFRDEWSKDKLLACIDNQKFMGMDIVWVRPLAV